MGCLVLSGTLLSSELVIEPYQFQDVKQFCEQLNALGVRSTLFGEECDLLADSREIWLVFGGPSRQLISILRTERVREDTTILLTGSFLDIKDVDQIYRTMFDRIGRMWSKENAWAGISWVAVHQEIFNLVDSLDEKQFPILFSLEEQLFAATPIATLVPEPVLEVAVQDSAYVNWKWAAVGGLAVVGGGLIYKALRASQPSPPSSPVTPVARHVTFASPLAETKLSLDERKQIQGLCDIANELMFRINQQRHLPGQRDDSTWRKGLLDVRSELQPYASLPRVHKVLSAIGQYRLGPY